MNRLIRLAQTRVPTRGVSGVSVRSTRVRPTSSSQTRITASSGRFHGQPVTTARISPLRESAPVTLQPRRVRPTSRAASQTRWNGTGYARPLSRGSAADASVVTCPGRGFLLEVSSRFDTAEVG